MQKLYDTRSSFATIVLSNGSLASIHIAQMMSHTDIDMLIHKYNKFIPAEVRKIDKSI